MLAPPENAHGMDDGQEAIGSVGGEDEAWEVAVNGTIQAGIHTKPAHDSPNLTLNSS
jgi:hypothetical protein